MVWEGLRAQSRNLDPINGALPARGEETPGRDNPAALPGLDSFLTAEFRFCPLWFFEATEGRLRFLETDFAAYGVEMRPNEWLVTASDGLMESCSVAYMYKNLALKDWVAFAEKFGFPGVLGQTDAPLDSPGWKAMEEAVKNFMNDWAAVANRTDAISLIESKTQGAHPFQPLVDYMDRSVAAVWRGADLSTISQGKEGVGASLQGDETALLEQDDAQLMTETLNLQVDPYVLKYLFGTNHPLAYIKVLPPNRQDVDRDIKTDTFLVTHGAPLSLSGAMERYGRSMPKGKELILSPPVKTTKQDHETTDRVSSAANETIHTLQDSTTSKLIEAASDLLAKAQADALQPIRNRLADILQIENETVQKAALASFRIELPRLLRELAADPKPAEVIEQTLAAALLNGAAVSQSGRAVPARSAPPKAKKAKAPPRKVKKSHKFIYDDDGHVLGAETIEEEVV